MQTFTLNNGVQIPVLGFGVFQIPPAETAQAVAEAIKAGYRHIDTAQAYMNEAEVGQGVKQSGVPREEIFITSKVWVENYGYEAAKASLDRSLGRLNLDYIDMVLIHQPYGDSYGTWRARRISGSRQNPRHRREQFFACARGGFGLFNKVMPQANQIEINPFQQKNDEVAALQAEGIAVEAWAPFAEGKNDIFHNPVLSKIGAKYGKSVAQVITRWLVERGIVVLAKSTKPERMAENLNVFDFALSDEDKAEIAKLDGTFAAIRNHDTVDNLKRIAAWKTGQ